MSLLIIGICALKYQCIRGLIWTDCNMLKLHFSLLLLAFDWRGYKYCHLQKSICYILFINLSSSWFYISEHFIKVYLLKDLFLIFVSCVLFFIFLFLTFMMVVSFILYIMFLLAMKFYCKYVLWTVIIYYCGLMPYRDW